MSTATMTPGDRRELRAIVKKQFLVLRAEVKRRAVEMEAEIEADLLRRYREQDDAIAAARQELEELTRETQRQISDIQRRLVDAHPELQVEARIAYGRLALSSEDPNRVQLHRAALAAVPTKVQDALGQLDQDELGLLRELTVGALTTDEAHAFLQRIPTVGALVPTARLPQLEASRGLPT